jgi:hypothetical protein
MSIKDKIKKYKEMEAAKIEKTVTESKFISEKKKIFETKQPEKVVEKIVAPKDDGFQEKLEDWKTLEELEKKATVKKIDKPKKKPVASTTNSKKEIKK